MDACTDQGRSSLLYACSKGHQGIVKKLLDEGADINIQDKIGASPLHRAAGCGRLEMVKFLLNSANSMDLNMQDNYGNTPLHAACEDGSVDVAKLLISAGANQFILNREEKKPLEVCKPEVARAIMER